MGLRIDVLCNDGSPIGVTSRSIWGDGVQIGIGGAELALLTFCEEMTKRGHKITLYNNPRHPNASPFEQRHINDFDPSSKRDVVIIFRSPNHRGIATSGLKVWWSCDQFTVGDFSHFSKFVDKIVCISPFHLNYFRAKYGITNATVIDIPVRAHDYKEVSVERIPFRFIFTSVPDRGLQNLLRIWPKIKQEFPQSSLVITSDYRLWGPENGINPQHRVGWVGSPDVQYVGAVPRSRLIEEQLKADFNIYPCGYDELFCIAIAEAQVAGALPITTAQGALSTTNMYKAIPVDANNPINDVIFVEALKGIVNNSDRQADRFDMMQKALNRFHPDVIMDKWEKEVFS